MTDYKLVPMEPTEAMIDAARDQHEGEPYLPVSLYKAMLAAAPAVQGEPVPSGWMLFPKTAWDFLCGTGELNGFGFGDRPRAQPPFWWRPVIRKMLDSAPQPAEQRPTPDVACSQSRESAMVVLEQGPDGTPSVWCDPEIADLVSALNKAGIRTVASCSGHGHRPGNIMLSDGRELVIARDFDEARKIDAMFPGINGEPPMVDVAALVEALEMARDRLESERRSGEWDPLLRDIDAALAAHRNMGGGE